MTKFKVTLVGAASITTPFGARWRKGQAQVLLENDPNLAYYRRGKAFNVGEVAGQKPVDKPKTEDVVPLAAAPSSAAAAAADPVVEPKTSEASDIPSDAELSKLNKTPLLDVATELGLAVDESMTKAEIRAEIDKLR